MILEALRELTPDIPVVAEEAVARGEIPSVGGGRFWLVDPLDGTQASSSRGTASSRSTWRWSRAASRCWAWSPHRRQGLAWWGAAGQGAFRREDGEVTPIRVRPRPQQGAVAVASRSHRDAETDAWLAERGIADTVSAGSSLKFCLVAEGKADVYPRFGPRWSGTPPPATPCCAPRAAGW